MFLNVKCNLKLKTASVVMTLLVSSLASISHAVHFDADPTLANNFQVISGSFFMPTVTAEAINLVPGITTVGSESALVEGGFQGDLPSGPYPNIPFDPIAAGNTVFFAPFLFFGNPVGLYTTSTGVDGVTHNVPHVDLANGVADFGSMYAYWNGIEFNQGSTTVSVIDNFDGTYKFIWSSLIVGGPFNGKTGEWTMLADCTTCPPTVAGPSATLSIVQASQATHTVTQDQGLFTVSTNAANIVSSSFGWTQSDAAILAGGALTDQSTLIIDPSIIPVGRYQIKVQISDNTDITLPVVSAATIIVNIVAAGALADIGDDDGDGVSNINDTINTATQLQSQNGNNTNFIMESNSGSLTIGDVAVCAGASSSAVSVNDIKNNAGLSCTAAANALDNLGEISANGGYFDFALRGVTQGGSNQVVIPLTSALLKNAGYRSYSFTGGWKPFTTLFEADITVAVTATGDGSATVSIVHGDHGYFTGDSITIAGATGDVNINGEFVITVVDKNTYTYTALAAVANGVEAGVVSALKKAGVNFIHSASSTSGTCPAVGDTVWTLGLTEGHHCIRLTISEGGDNDADGQANGIVTSVGTTIGYASIRSDLINGCSLSSQTTSLKDHMEWLVLALFLAGLGLRRRQSH